MMAPIGTNTNAIRFLTNFSGAAQAARGSIASRNGRPSEAPRPWRSVRRESDFMRTLDGKETIGQSIASRLLNAPQLERSGLDDGHDQCREPIVLFQTCHDLV